PIPAETARRIACDCSLTAVVDGEAQGTQRVVPGPMRRALVARDKGCRFEGCDMPAAWTDSHHIKHWADGGPHKLWNLILLCRRHTGWCMRAAGGWWAGATTCCRRSRPRSAFLFSYLTARQVTVLKTPSIFWILSTISVPI